MTIDRHYPHQLFGPMRAMTGYEIESVRALLPLHTVIDSRQALVMDRTAIIPTYIVSVGSGHGPVQGHICIIHNGQMVDTGSVTLTTIQDALAWLANQSI
jgi:hypothetical protein